MIGQSKETTTESYTPQSLFNLLNEEFNFTLDPCEATFGPKLCPNGYKLRDNGLSKPWYGRVYMNPPYGRDIWKWIKKAYNEAILEHHAELIVALLPVRADTQWWHDWVLEASEIRFLRPRIRFIGPDQKPMKGRAPFASAIVIWEGLGRSGSELRTWSVDLPPGAK